MARKMYISDDMGLDEGLADIAQEDPIAAAIWPWIIPYFDDWGRADASPRRLRGKVFSLFDTFTVEIVARALDAFAAKGLIERYVVDGHEWMRIEPSKWFSYQSHIHSDKRTKDGSRVPVPGPEGPRDPAGFVENPRVSARSRETPRKNALPLSTPHLTTVTPQPPPGGVARASKYAWLSKVKTCEVPVADFFEVRFYPAYPRKEAPQAAWGEMRKLCDEWSPDFGEVIMKSLTSYSRCDQWQDATKIPHPATWLHQRRWEGSPPGVSPQQPLPEFVAPPDPRMVAHLAQVARERAAQQETLQ